MKRFTQFQFQDFQIPVMGAGMVRRLGRCLQEEQWQNFWPYTKGFAASRPASLDKSATQDKILHARRHSHTPVHSFAITLNLLAKIVRERSDKRSPGNANFPI